MPSRPNLWDDDPDFAPGVEWWIGAFEALHQDFDSLEKRHNSLRENIKNAIAYIKAHRHGKALDALQRDEWKVRNHVQNYQSKSHDLLKEID